MSYSCFAGKGGPFIWLLTIVNHHRRLCAFMLWYAFLILREA